MRQRQRVQHADDEEYDPLFSRQERSEVAGRRWSLYFAALPGFNKGAESNLPAFVLASGIGASVLLFGISWMLVRSRILAERASKDLEEANKELEVFSSEAETRHRTLVEQIPAITSAKARRSTNVDATVSTPNATRYRIGEPSEATICARDRT